MSNKAGLNIIVGWDDAKVRKGIEELTKLVKEGGLGKFSIDSSGAIKSADSTATAIKKVKTQVDQSVQGISVLNSTLDENQKYWEILTGSVDKNQKYLALLKNELKAIQLQKKSLGQDTKQLTSRELELRAGISDLTATLKLQQKELINESGSIDHLRARLALLTKAFNAMSAEQRSMPFGKFIEAEGLKTSATLKQLEGRIGDHRRNVGDYGNAMQNALSGAWKGIRMFAYLIPGLGIAGVFDLIAQAIKALWEEFRNGNGALNEFKRNVEITAESLKDSGYTQARVKVAELREELELAKEGKISAKLAIDNYNDSLGKATGGVASLGEMERKLAQSAEGYLQMLALKTKATIAYRKAAEEGVLADIEVGQVGDYGAGMMRFLKDPRKWFDPAASSDPYRAQFDFIKKKRNSETLLNKMADEYQKQAADVANKYKLNFFNNTDIKKAKDQRQDIYNDAKALKDLTNEIADSGKKFEIKFESNADSERDKIIQYFKELKQKVKDFNADPGRRFKVDTKKAFSDIENKRQTSLDNVDYAQETKDLLSELEIRKKEYADYENLKFKIGSEAADKQYKSLIRAHKTYIQRLEAEESALYNKGRLTTLEDDRYRKVQDALQKARTDQKAEESKWLAEMLTNYATYEQKKAGIINQREDDIKRAINSGNRSLIKGITENADKALQQLDESTAREKQKLGGFFDDMILTSEKAVRAQIQNIKQLLDNSTLSPEQKKALQTSLAEAESILGKSSNEKERIQLSNRLQSIDAEILRIGNDTSKAKTELDKLFKDRAGVVQRLKDLDDLKEKINTLRAIGKAIGGLGGVLSSLGDANPALAELGKTLTSVAGSIDEFLTSMDTLADRALTSAEKITIAANFIINAISNIVSSAQQNKLKEAEAIKNVTEYQRGYNLALIQEQKIKEGLSGNIFYKNNMATVRANLKEQVSLVNEYNKAMGDLQDGQIKVGTTKAKRDWVAVGGSTLAGAGSGALIGANAAGVGSIPGAIIGGIVGFVSGMLKKRQVIDVYDNLLKVHKGLVDEEGNLNEAMAKTLLTSNLLDAKTKDTLQYVSNLTAEYKEAQKEINAVIKELIGDVGNNIMSAIVTDFKAGGLNAGEAFRQGFAKSLERLYEDIIYAAILGKGLEEMQKRIERGFEQGDMNIMETAMYEFLDSYGGKAQAAQDMMKKAQEYAKAKGIEMWKSEGEMKKTGKNSLTGAYSQASQESIDLLSGHSMGIKLAVLDIKTLMQSANFDSREVMERSLSVLSGIKKDTGNIDTNTRDIVPVLKSIDNKMNNSDNHKLAAGIR